jgi:hypothetical protein
MLLSNFYGIQLPVWESDISQIERRHIKVLFLKRLIAMKREYK